MAAVGLNSTARNVQSGALPASMVPLPREELFSVLVVNGHRLLRETMTSQLRSMGAGAVYEASTISEARNQARASGPCDLAIVDIGLPEHTGIQLLSELRSQGWPKVIVVAPAEEPYAVRAAFHAGAHAYLLTRSTSGTDAPTFEAVDAPHGAAYSGPQRVLSADNTPRELSAREIEVLRRVGDGESNKEIGDSLGLSALTVKSHLSRIGRKLGTGDRAHMVALAMRAGLFR